jgi:hypothetical protein
MTYRNDLGALLQNRQRPPTLTSKNAFPATYAVFKIAHFENFIRDGERTAS